MNLLQAALKLQTRARGMNDRKKVSAAKASGALPVHTCIYANNYTRVDYRNILQRILENPVCVLYVVEYSVC